MTQQQLDNLIPKLIVFTAILFVLFGGGSCSPIALTGCAIDRPALLNWKLRKRTEPRRAPSESDMRDANGPLDGAAP